jgi:hypothetical protein
LEDFQMRHDDSIWGFWEFDAWNIS